MVYKPSSYSLLVYQVYLFDLQTCSDPHCTYCTYCIRHYTSSTYRTLYEHYTSSTYRTLYEHYTSSTYRTLYVSYVSDYGSTGSWSNGLVHPVPGHFLGEAVPPTS